MDNPAELDPDLVERVRLLSARVMFREAVGPDLVRLACDLLVEGVDTPAVVQLAGQPSSATMADLEPIFNEVLVEIGCPPLPKTESGWLLARAVARQMVANSIPQNVGAGILWGLWWDIGQPSEIATLVQLLDAREEALDAGRAAIDEEIRSIAPAVIRAADRAIT